MTKLIIALLFTATLILAASPSTHNALSSLASHKAETLAALDYK